MRHDTKRADEVADALHHGVTEFLIPAYYWTGGRFPHQAAHHESLDDFPRGDHGFRIIAESIHDAVAEITDLCQEYPESFLYVTVDVTGSDIVGSKDGTRDVSMDSKTD